MSRANITRRGATAGLLATASALFAGCSQNSPYLSNSPPPQSSQAPPGAVIGTGQVKAALILPLSAPGNAGVAGQAMRNAAEMAVAEFNAPNIQILVKDGTAEAGRIAAQQSLDEGAEIILGPLFAQSVSFVGQVAQPRNIPVIAFSTDAHVASRGGNSSAAMPPDEMKSRRLMRPHNLRPPLWHIASPLLCATANSGGRCSRRVKGRSQPGSTASPLNSQPRTQVGGRGTSQKCHQATKCIAQIAA
jgi:substrate-binding family protein